MARKDSTLTVEQARKCFSYDPETGCLTKLIQIDRSKLRYRTVKIGGQVYPEHHIVWLLCKGRWPDRFIDHINGDPSDNRIENLREVTHGENMQNRRRAQKNNKSSGLLGASMRANGKWDARISVKGKNLYIGCFDTAEEAHQAYLSAKRVLHPACTI